MAYEIEYNGNIIEAPDEATANKILTHIASTQQTQSQPMAQEPSFFDKVNSLKNTVNEYAPYVAGAGAAGPLIKEFISGPSIDPTLEVNKGANPITAAVLSGINSASFNKFPEAYGAGLALAGGNYEQEKAQEAARIAELGQMYPGSALVGSVPGLIFGAPAKVARGAMAMLPQTTSLVGRVASNALINNLLGQLMAPTDASAGDRASQALQDTLFSGGIDSVLGILGKYRQLSQISDELAQGGPSAVSVPYSSKVIPQAVEARSALAKEVPQAGVAPMTAAEMTQTGGLDAIQGTLAQSPISGGNVRKIGMAQQEYQNAIAKELEGRVGLSTEGVPNPLNIEGKNLISPEINIQPSVENINQIYTNKVQASKERFARAYSDIQKQLNETKASKFVASNAYEVAQDLRTLVSEGAGGVTTPGLKRVLNEANALQTVEQKIQIPDGLGGTRTLKETREVPAQVSLRDLHKLRQDVSDIMFKSGNKVEQAQLGKLKDAIDQDIEAYGNQVSLNNPTLGSQILETNRAFGLEKNALKSDVLESIQRNLDTTNGSTYELSKATDSISKAIRDGRVDQLQKIEGIVGEEAMQPIKQAQMQRLLRGSRTDEYDLIGGTPGAPHKNPFYKRVNALDDKTLNYLFGQENARTLKNLAQIVPYMESARIASEPAKGWFYKLLNGAGLGFYGSAVFGGGKAAAAGTLLGAAGLNKLLSKWYSSPAVTELLIRNNRPITSPQMGRFMANRLLEKMIELESREAGNREDVPKVSE